MEIDQVTLRDLSFLGKEGSIFSLINHCISRVGSHYLKQHILTPPTHLEEVLDFQKAVRFWMKQEASAWPSDLTNGTIVMVQEFFESSSTITSKPGRLQLWLIQIGDRLFKKTGHGFALFSIKHLATFFKACQALLLFLEEQPPLLVRKPLLQIKDLLQKNPLVQTLIQTNPHTPVHQWVALSYLGRRKLKNIVLQIIPLFAQLDATRAMAKATQQENWTLPSFIDSKDALFKAQHLTHPLVKKAVGFDLELNQKQPFLFLTGANMSGKSTLLYSLGITLLLAHLGMGVPASALQLSFFNGLITNMHVEDNILLGESYFFAEVQRMKHTAKQLSKKGRYLVLMDELFKGTNGFDAYECSLAVIRALLKQKQHLMALSTHLSELYEDLQTEEAFYSGNAKP